MFERFPVRAQAAHTRLQLWPAMLECLELGDLVHEKDSVLVYQPRELRSVESTGLLIAVCVQSGEARVARIGWMHMSHMPHPRSEMGNGDGLVAAGRAPLHRGEIAAVQRVAVEVKRPVRHDPRPWVTHKSKGERPKPGWPERALPQQRRRMMLSHHGAHGARMWGTMGCWKKLLVRKELKGSLHEEAASLADSDKANASQRAMASGAYVGLVRCTLDQNSAEFSRWHKTDGPAATTGPTQQHFFDQSIAIRSDLQEFRF